MIPDDDRRWGLLKGRYRIPYDPRPALSRLRSDGADAKAWADLWENLHHQGDVDDAAYASIAALRELEHGTEAQALQHAIAVILLSKGLARLGALVWYHDDSTLREFLDERLAWTEWYRQ